MPGGLRPSKKSWPMQPTTKKYKKYKKTFKKNYKYKCRTLKNRESMLAMWMSTRIKIPHVPKNSISLSIPSQNALKILTREAFCKKWGVRVKPCGKTTCFCQKKCFLRQPGLSHSLVEIPRGIIYVRLKKKRLLAKICVWIIL